MSVESIAPFVKNRLLTVGSVLLRHVQFAQSEIAERDMSSVVEQDVLGFQIASSRRYVPCQPRNRHDSEFVWLTGR